MFLLKLVSNAPRSNGGKGRMTMGLKKAHGIVTCYNSKIISFSDKNSAEQLNNGPDLSSNRPLIVPIGKVLKPSGEPIPARVCGAFDQSVRVVYYSSCVSHDLVEIADNLQIMTGIFKCR